MRAGKHNHVACAESLLNYSADTELPEYDVYTPPHGSSCDGRLTI